MLKDVIFKLQPRLQEMDVLCYTEECCENSGCVPRVAVIPVDMSDSSSFKRTFYGFQSLKSNLKFSTVLERMISLLDVNPSCVLFYLEVLGL